MGFLWYDRLAMSESKLTRRRHARILIDGARCIYCGDPADTIDHMPPSILFRYKHRPKGLEFPSCAACNSGTSHADLVAAFFTRFSDHYESNDQLHAEAKQIGIAIKNNIPGFFDEISNVGPDTMRTLHQINQIRPDFVVRGQAILNLGGPIAKRYLDVFSAKMGFALYYETTGSIVPADGGVTAAWKPNLVTKLAGIPAGFRNLFVGGSTLSQGSVKVSDQFEYYVNIVKADGILGTYMVRLLEGLTIFAFASSQRRAIKNAPEKFGWEIYSPGDFKARS
jgi:hypothetical protein